MDYGAIPSFEAAAIDLSLLQQDARGQVQDALAFISGTKALYVDADMMAGLRMLFENGFNDLRDAKVQYVQPLTLNVPLMDAGDVVFLVQPTLAKTRLVARAVRAHQDAGLAPSFHVLFLPHRAFIADQVLAEEGVLEEYDTIDACEVDLIPLDDDLLSMEAPAGFRDAFLHGDRGLATSLTRALLRLQLLYGLAPHVHAQGELAVGVAAGLLAAKNDVLASGAGEGVSFPADSRLDSIVLLDRTVDFVSPLLSPLSFEALVAEVLGMTAGVVTTEPEQLALDPKAANGGRREGATEARIALNAGDAVYAEVRGMHISVVPEYLARQSAELQAWYDDRLALDATDEIASYVRNIAGKQASVRAIAQMITFAGIVQEASNSDAFSEQWQMERSMLDRDNDSGVAEYLGAAIAQGAPLTRVLRLACLHSQCAGGLSRSTLDALRKDILDAYGFEHALTLEQLQRVGLLRAGGAQVLSFTGFGGGSAWPWAALRRDLALMDGEVSVSAPTSPHYLTSGYAPLSARVAHLAVTQPRGMPGVPGVKGLTGPSLSLLQLPAAQSVEEATAAAAAGGSGSAGSAAAEAPRSRFEGGSSARRTVLVVFLGGVSYLEVAALRFLSEREPLDFLIATDALITGNSLVEGASAPLTQRAGFLATLEAKARGDGVAFAPTPGAAAS